MSKILNTNVFNDKINSVLSVAVTVDAGTVTDDTDIDKLMNRNVADAYVFTPSNTTTLYIGVTSNQFGSITTMGLLGTGVTPTALKWGAGTPSNTITPDDTLTKTRSLLSSPLDYTTSAKEDIVYFFPSQGTTATFYFQFSVSAGVQYTIGSVWGSNYIDIGITPHSAITSARDTTTFDISNGGQKYINTGAVIDSIKFNVPSLNNAQSILIRDLNNKSGIAHPCIVVPYMDDNLMIYGTQKTLAKLTPISKNDVTLTKSGTVFWYYKCNMEFQEEL